MVAELNESTEAHRLAVGLLLDGPESMERSGWRAAIDTKGLSITARYGKTNRSFLCRSTYHDCPWRVYVEIHRFDSLAWPLPGGWVALEA